ncbi:SWR1-complex protein 3, partial [Monosporozyma unispora]
LRRRSTRSTDTTTPEIKHERKRIKRNVNSESHDDQSELSLVESFTKDRPFEIISNFPATIDSQNYNSILTHPLTIKDSAVLYNSLYQSRKTWIYNFGNLFPLYWKKEFLESNLINDDDVSNFSIKDKMQKMSDCVMVGGPHTFNIRLFILKDESIETSWQIEQDSKKKEKEQKKQNEIDAKRKKHEDKLKKRLAKEQEKLAKKQAKLKAKEEKALLLQKKKEEAK